jgi:predicted transcriptional regulator
MSYGRSPVLKGDARTALANDLAERYRGGASIRVLARHTDRSYGNVRRLLQEAGVELRSRGGDQRSAERRARGAR